MKINTKHLFVILFALPVFAASIWWGLPHAVSPETVSPWGANTVAPIMPLNEAYYKFTREGNETPYYPLFHFFILNIAYAPYLGYQYLIGNIENPSNNFPYGLKEPEHICRNLTLIARAISLIMGLGIISTMYNISKELFSDEVGFWTSLLVVFLAPLTYYATTSNLDVPYLFWSCLAILQYIRILKSQKLKNYIYLAICVALSIATKDQAYGFFLLIPIVILYALSHHNTDGKVKIKDIGRALISKPILISLVMTILVFALANNLIFGGWSGFIRHIKAPFDYIDQAEAVNPKAHFPGLQLELLSCSLRMLVQIFGYGTLLLCIGGIVYVIYKRKWLALSILLFPLSYYISVLAVVETMTVRYLLGPAILITPFAGVLIVDLLKKKKNIIKLIAISWITASISWQVALTANLTLTLVKDSRYDAESWIKTNIPHRSEIESQVWERYLPHISENYNIVVKGVDEFNELIVAELTAESLQERAPEYIILLKGFGLTGDPDKWTDVKLLEYHNALIEEKLRYQVIAEFPTPHFVPFLQIASTRPTVIILRKSNQ